MPSYVGDRVPYMNGDNLKNLTIMKKLFAVCLIAFAFTMSSHAAGIEFFHGTWAEGVAKAKAENKKIFIDFFTEWCGPDRKSVV